LVTEVDTGFEHFTHSDGHCISPGLGLESGQHHSGTLFDRTRDFYDSSETSCLELYIRIRATRDYKRIPGKFQHRHACGLRRPAPARASGLSIKPGIFLYNDVIRAGRFFTLPRPTY
jgi:hypothetical protein